MLKSYHHRVPLLRNLGNLSFWNPMDNSRPVMGRHCLYLYFVEYLTQAQSSNFHILKFSVYIFTSSGITLKLLPKITTQVVTTNSHA